MRHAAIIKRKSGQAIIFLMVVIVIGLFVVIWNFDLHRIITAKLKVRNAADAAAMAGARWQGVSLNMIGDLNLIQAAYLAIEAENQDGTSRFIVPPELLTRLVELRDLRSRLAFYSPLAAFAIAQQAAFDNGAFRDPQVEADLLWMAEEFRSLSGAPPFDNMDFDDYAELLEGIVAHGVAAGSYTVRLPGHPLAEEEFYSGIAAAASGIWCGLEDYDYWLEQYDGVESWPKLDTEIPAFYMLDLKLQEWTSRFVDEDTYPPRRPPTAIATNWAEYRDYLNADQRGIFSALGADSYNYAGQGIYPYRPDEPIRWHIYDNDWQKPWPRPRDGYDNLEGDEDMDRFPIWGDIQDKFNYMGAEAGFSIAAQAHRGILASAASDTVDLTYKAKAKPFGFIEAQLQDSPPYYLGFVFPVFTDVRLIHSDIGDRQVSPVFFRHVMAHLEAYLQGGPDALNPGCPYCQLLKAWETLDRDEGLRWLDKADGMQENPCEDEFEGMMGGATRGS